MDWLETLLTAIETVGADILENWAAFLTIFVLHTIAVAMIVRQYYKHERENINYDKERLEKQKSEYDTLRKEHDRYKAEIEAPAYQAYLMARNASDTNLSDAEMFLRK